MMRWGGLSKLYEYFCVDERWYSVTLVWFVGRGASSLQAGGSVCEVLARWPRWVLPFGRVVVVEVDEVEQER